MNSNTSAGLLKKEDTDETRKKKLLNRLFGESHFLVGLSNEDENVFHQIERREMGASAYDRHIRSLSGIPRVKIVAHFEQALQKGYIEAIYRACVRYEMPFEIVFQMLAESKANPNIGSFAGATGLMQFMSATGRAYGLKDSAQRKDPFLSIDAGARYLRDLYNKTYEWDSEINNSPHVPENLQKIHNPNNITSHDRMFWAFTMYNGGSSRNGVKARYFIKQGQTEGFLKRFGTSSHRGVRENGQYVGRITAIQQILHRYYRGEKIADQYSEPMEEKKSEADVFFEKYKNIPKDQPKNRMDFLREAKFKYELDATSVIAYREAAIGIIEEEMKTLRVGYPEIFEEKGEISADDESTKDISAIRETSNTGSESLSVTIKNETYDVPILEYRVHENDQNLTQIATRLSADPSMAGLVLKIMKDLNPDIDPNKIHKGMLLRIPAEKYIVPRQKLPKIVKKLYPKLDEKTAIAYIKLLNRKSSGEYNPQSSDENKIIGVGEEIIIPFSFEKPIEEENDNKERLNKLSAEVKSQVAPNGKEFYLIGKKLDIRATLSSFQLSPTNIQRAVNRINRYKKIKNLKPNDRVSVESDSQGFLFLSFYDSEKNKMIRPMYLYDDENKKVK